MSLQRNKVGILCVRPRKTSDDAFIIKVALQTLRRIYRQSTGQLLTKAMILQQLRVNTTTMIVEYKGQPIGYYCYTMVAPKRMYLSALVLSPKAQGRGFGRAIVSQIDREACIQKAHTICAHVQASNSRAIVFWIQNGYRILYPQMKGMLAIEKALPNRIVPHL